MYLSKGDTAPAFSLPDQNGNLKSLEDFSGSKIVLWFFPKANTPGWILEGIGFRDEFDKFLEQEIEIVGVSADTPDKQKKFEEKFNFSFYFLSDESKEMLIAYKAWGKKKFMGREYNGIHRITYIINENGIIQHTFEKVKTKSHARDVLAVLSE